MFPDGYQELNHGKYSGDGLLMKEENWRKYDSVAETYARVATPHYFAGPAEDLVLLMGLPGGARVLDVGTGVGTVGAAAVNIVGSDGAVVGVDVSVRMMAEARQFGFSMLVAGGLPHLPYHDEVFDGVAAGFLLNHISDCDLAIREMARVGKCEARIGASSWAKSTSDEDLRQAWQEVAQNFITRDDLNQAVKRALPSADRFTDAGAFEDTLRNGGLKQIVVSQKEYPIRIEVADYVSAKALGMSARFMQSLLSADKWKQFIDAVSARIQTDFGDHLAFTTKVNFAVGVKIDG